MKKISLNLEKCFETVTTRLLFSKLILNLLFSHKILIFLKNLGGPNLLLDPPLLFWGVHGPPGPPGSGPHVIRAYTVHLHVHVNILICQKHHPGSWLDLAAALCFHQESLLRRKFCFLFPILESRLLPLYPNYYCTVFIPNI